MTLFASAEGRRAARLLEFPQLLDQVAAHAVLARSADRVRSLEPIDDPDGLERLWAWVRELDRFRERGHDVPLGDFVDLEVLVGLERAAPGPLEPAELAAVGAACLAMAVVVETVERHPQALGITRDVLRHCDNPRPVGEHLQAALEPDGRLKDAASPRLKGLRQALTAAERKLREDAGAAMAEAVRKEWTTAGELVLREGRYCVPLRSGKRAQLPGIVHDRSDTGHTLFVEPLAVVEASNLVQESRLAVVEEERRIIASLNRQVADRGAALLDLYRKLVDVDAVRARVVWGRRHGGRIPRFGRRGTGDLRLCGFRHPLLRASLQAAGREDELVPLHLKLRPQDRLVLISGPNAGGKTVTLKAVGIAALMAQCGIPLPADDEPRLPVFDRVLMDAGDDQSIADALSSFSAHMTHLREILQERTDASLVLLDEVGGGTDPVEGVALAQAMLEHLVRDGLTFSTTHYGQLKALVHHRPGFRNASMAFDHERLEPRFELVLDQPGSSHALEIASRLRLPGPILERARALVGTDSLRLEAVIRDMDAARARLASELAEAETRHHQARAAQRRYEELAKELREKRRDTLEAARREAEGIVRNARARIERLLSRIRSSAGGEGPLEAAAEAREEVDRTLERLERQRRQERRSPPLHLAEGALVRHRGLDQVGRVREVKGRRVTLEINGRRVVARLDELLAHDAQEPLAERPLEGSVRADLEEVSALAASRVDVRGMDAEDAWVAVDRALDRGLLSGVSTFEIVHGKGTGRLRESLNRRLGRDPRVKSARVGGGGLYDEGVTVVEI